MNLYEIGRALFDQMVWSVGIPTEDRPVSDSDRYLLQAGMAPNSEDPDQLIGFALIERDVLLAAKTIYTKVRS